MGPGHRPGQGGGVKPLLGLGKAQHPPLAPQRPPLPRASEQPRSGYEASGDNLPPVPSPLGDPHAVPHRSVPSNQHKPFTGSYDPLAFHFPLIFHCFAAAHAAVPLPLTCRMPRLLHRIRSYPARRLWRHCLVAPAHSMALVGCRDSITASGTVLLAAFGGIALLLMAAPWERKDVGALPQTLGGVSPLHPDQGWQPWTPLLAIPIHQILPL